MDKFKRLKWESKFSVHVAKIDAQHRKLFDIANEMIDIYESKSKGRLKIIEELVEYANVHFHTEQLLMMDAKYPGFKEQLAQHNYFINQVSNLLQGLKNQEKSLSSDIVNFLTTWIYTHTTFLDLKIGEYIIKSGYLKE